MTEGLADPAGVPTVALERLYGLWSDGGAGLLLSGNILIDGDHLERPGMCVLTDALLRKCCIFLGGVQRLDERVFGAIALALGRRLRLLSNRSGQRAMPLEHQVSNGQSYPFFLTVVFGRSSF
jgi:hypothetical protein